jgi:pseudouridine-5'-phosphate glycosidase
MQLIIHEEIKHALANNIPIVALESTVIAHGLPFPDNLEMALGLEQAIRAQQAVPATIAIIDGSIRIGLKAHEFEKLADARNSIRKVSRRDIAYTVATKASGATTVSATMSLAHKASIKFFATGGIGGVHRYGEVSMDISADLYELHATPIAVVCAGAKSILDLAKTLEVLESLGVPVWGYRTEYFPEFFCKGTNYKLDMTFEHINLICDALAIHWSLGLQNGIIIAQPVPAGDALDNESMHNSLQEALALAQQHKIHGKDVTPFLLRQIAQKSNNKSLLSNKSLLLENATLAAKIANNYYTMLNNNNN